MNISIRKAKYEDLPELKRIFIETILEICKNEYSVNERIVWSNAVHKTEKWEASIRNEFFIVAENDKEIVGFSSLKNKDYLNLMYVHKEYTRKGIASILYENIKRKSLELGAEKLTVDVSKTAKLF